MKPTVDEIQSVFFNAMAEGWAQGANEISIAELPGSKSIQWGQYDFRVTDTYFVNPITKKSIGTTMIFYRDDLVWTMNYGGWYSDTAIPFLKKCLHRAYVKERRFFGGRGPEFVRGKRFTYINRIRLKAFYYFSGEEHVFDLSGQCQGHHWYNGMSLI